MGKLSIVVAVFGTLLVGCSTIVVNIGDKAIEQYCSKKGQTNAVLRSESVGTNFVVKTEAQATLIVNINMNATKDVSPDSKLSLK